jgi:hypothetical protein
MATTVPVDAKNDPSYEFIDIGEVILKINIVIV